MQELLNFGISETDNKLDHEATRSGSTCCT